MPTSPVLALPWFWLPDLPNEGLTWRVLIGGSGFLYGLLLGLLLARRFR
jgi:hypothetical protein